MAYSYSTQGATPSAPQIGPSSYTSLQSAGMTPYSSALNTASGLPTLSGSFSNTNPLGSMQTTTPATSTPTDFSKLASTSGLIPKSQTITNADGSSHTTTYQAPIQGDSLLSGVAKTPEEMAAANTTGTGAGSKDPTANQTLSSSTAPTFGGIIGQVVQGASQPGQAYTNAQGEYQNAIDAYNKIKQNEAASMANVSGITEPLEFQQGQKQILENQYAGQLAGAGGLVQGASNALNAANTQQQTQQAGLLGAAGAAQPQLGQYGQAYYSPLSAGASGGGQVQPSDPFYQTLQNYAKLAASGQIAQVPSSITSNSVLFDQMNQMAKAINPSYTPTSSTGAGQVLQTIPAMQSANTAAKGIEQQITSFLSANPTLNSSPLAVGNAAQQWLQGKQLADPAYQNLFNMLSEYTNTLAPILGVGGDPTNLKTQIAQGFINAQATGASISSVLQNIATLADNKILNLQSGATGGSVINTSQNGTSNIYAF